MIVKECKIAIYGAGAMGTTLGALLTLGGLKGVHLITRNTAHIDGLNTNGAQIVCEAEGKELCVPVTAFTPDQMTEKYDVVFLMTKQKHNAETLQFLLPYLKNDGVICTTQNGLPEPLIAKIIGKNRTYGAVLSYGATVFEGGRVALTSKFDGMRAQISGFENDEKHTALLQEILSYAGKAIDNQCFAQITDNLLGVRWSKLALNSAFSGLSTVTGLTFGEVAKRRKSRKIALGILRECMDVATANGVSLEKMQGYDMQKALGGRSFFQTQFALAVLPFAMRKHKRLVSGMLKDIQKGKKCEIDFINGAVVKAGERVGVDTPLCAQIVEMAHGIENGFYEIAYENVDFFER